MPLTIALENERGEKRAVVFDDQGLLVTLILKTARKDSACIRLLDFVDPYGDTVFNALQMRQLNIELNELLPFAETPEAQDLLSSIQALVRQGQEGVHLYLKLIGD
jgi:hypothetical protein